MDCVPLLLYFIFLWNSLHVDAFGGHLHQTDSISTLEIIGNDIFFEITEPDYLRYTYRTRPARDIGTPFNSSFVEHGVRLVPVDPPTACKWLNNAVTLQKSVALIERGGCSFLSKTIMAEKAGARAVIISDDHESDEWYTEMIDDATGREAHIPATFLLGKNGWMIRNTLAKLNLEYAIINIPVNLSHVPLNEFHQPPWLAW